MVIIEKGEWLDYLQSFSPETLFQALASFVKAKSKWPPNLPEMLDACEKVIGVPALPDPHSVMQLAILRRFDHPVTKLVFDKIGSWDFGHDSEKVLLRKINSVYSSCVDEYRKLDLLLLEQTP